MYQGREQQQKGRDPNILDENFQELKKWILSWNKHNESQENKIIVKKSNTVYLHSKTTENNNNKKTHNHIQKGDFLQKSNKLFVGFVLIG